MTGPGTWPPAAREQHRRVVSGPAGTDRAATRMTEQLPRRATTADNAIVPSLVANEGDAAGWRYVEFFTANINNPNTRRAYARACARFFASSAG